MDILGTGIYTCPDLDLDLDLHIDLFICASEVEAVYFPRAMSRVMRRVLYIHVLDLLGALTIIYLK